MKLSFAPLACATIILVCANVLAATGNGGASMEKASALKDIYLAGGCFWGVQEYFSRIPGVRETESGYANSIVPNPDYRKVCSGATNAVEAVRVRYDSGVVGLDTLARQFFKIIDPFSVNQQGNDIGTQYRTGIYYTNAEDRNILDSIFAAARGSSSRPLAVELMPLLNFWPAENYHQDYLKKNPGGYCHIDFSSLTDLPQMRKETDAELRKTLSPDTYHVTRENGTEPPFSGKYWNNHEEGIYVDAVGGQPLFSSAKKFDSGTGWPSFTEPLEPSALIRHEDLSHGMRRIEVRSSKADSHLGHVFDDGPNGLPRYCINSAALRFIPYSLMDAEGYGNFKRLVRPEDK